MPTPSRPTVLFSSAAWLLAGTGFFLPGGAFAQSPAASPVSMTTTDNPLITESTLPYHLPPFDRIKDADYAPAFEQGMAEHLKEVDAIADNPAPATFENTIVALERSGRTLERVGLIFSNLAGANTNPAMQRTETEMAPKQAAHEDAVRLNTKLFARIQSSTTGVTTSASTRNPSTCSNATKRTSCAPGPNSPTPTRRN